MGKQRFFTINLILFLLIIILLAISLLMGSASLTVQQVYFGLISDPSYGIAQEVIWNLRLPRTLLAALIGMHFAISGLILQAVIRNPLADPSVIGISSGASLAVVVFLLLSDLIAGHLSSSGITDNPLAWIPLAAMLGGTATAFLVLGLSQQAQISPAKLALNGVAVGAVLNALVMWVVVVWGAGRSETSLIWLAGSLYGRDFSHLYQLLPWTLIGLACLMFLKGPLSLLRFNDDLSRSLGLHLKLWRLLSIILAVAFAASAISVSGPVGFVGLVIPHLARLLCGSDIRYLIITCLQCGALLMLAADLFGRLALSPVELPAGSITTLLGIPVFLILLQRQTWRVQ